MLITKKGLDHMERLHELTERMRRIELAGNFGKLIYCAAKSCTENARPIEIAERFFPRAGDVFKTAVSSMTSASGGAGASLAGAAYPQMSNEWVSLLDSRTLLGRLPFPRAN